MDRLTSHREFVAVLQRRHRVSRSDIVVHFLVRDDSHSGDPDVARAATPGHRRLGLAVAKSVGNAVTRNAVKRRFRVAARNHEESLPPDCDVVLRAKPSARAASFASLDRQVGEAFATIGRKAAGGR